MNSMSVRISSRSEPFPWINTVNLSCNVLYGSQGSIKGGGRGMPYPNTHLPALTIVMGPYK